MLLSILACRFCESRINFQERQLVSTEGHGKTTRLAGSDNTTSPCATTMMLWEGGVPCGRVEVSGGAKGGVRALFAGSVFGQNGRTNRLLQGKRRAKGGNSSSSPPTSTPCDTRGWGRGGARLLTTPPVGCYVPTTVRQPAKLGRRQQKNLSSPPSVGSLWWR